MERAVVLVGVSRARGMRELPGVEHGISMMADWAREQGLPEDRITVITDLDGSPVTIAKVSEAVRRYVEERVIEQLVIHFCGHGMIVDGSEVWLLTDATLFGHEAVSVSRTKLAAEQGLIPHVVLISDACRVLPSTVAEAATAGASIFPTQQHGNRCSVDLLFATRRGTPAFQIEDAVRAHAIYTEVVAEALHGDYHDLVHPMTDDDGQVGVVRVGPLYQALPALVAARLHSLGVSADQQPDGAVSWDTGNSWISRLVDRGSDDTGDSEGPRRGAGAYAPVPDAPPDPLWERAEEMTDRLWRLDPPDAFTGIQVVGSDVFGVQTGGVPHTVWRESIVVDLERPSCPALLRLDGDRLVVVPVLNGMVATLVVEDDELVDVTYSSSAAPTGYTYDRAWMGAASRWVLPWWGESGEELLQQHLGLVEQDPAAGVLVAHALNEMGRRDLVDRLLFSNALPDVAYLAPHADDVIPRGLPLLSRTWALLGEDGLAPRPDVPARLPSPWVMYAPEGEDQLHALLFPDTSLTDS